MEKIKNYLGISQKAGYLIIGSEKLDNYTKKIYLVLIDSLAGNTAKKIAKRYSEAGIEVKEVEGLGSLINLESCKILGIKNKGISQEISKLLN